MRKIKFRAWNKQTGKMHEVTDLTFDVSDDETIGLNMCGFSDCRTCIDWFNEEDVVLMQYTGLEDKNGVDIYERDIIEDSDKERHVVTFKNGGFGRDGKFLINYNTGEYIVTHEPLINSVIDICEVVGNIYEKPELLQEDNNE